MIGFGNMLKDYLEFNKITQSDFAKRLDISQKHMNEILNENADMSLDLMLAISLITDIDIDLIVFVENKKRIGNYLYKKFKTDKEINKYLNTMHINELKKKEWIKFKDIDNPVQKAMDLLSFLKIKNFESMEKYNDEKIMYKKADNADKFKILLWIRRCDQLIMNQEVSSYNSKNFNNVIEELKKEQNNKFSIDNITSILNKYGIYLAIEDALVGTKIRGCMQVKNTNPVIYLTKLYKDKSSFYFTLYHELGHVKTDYMQARNKIIVYNEKTENKADTFALNTMIDEKIWEQIKTSNEETIKNISNKNNIPMCFIISRLAKEKYISYTSEFYNNYKEQI